MGTIEYKGKRYKKKKIFLLTLTDSYAGYFRAKARYALRKGIACWRDRQGNSYVYKTGDVPDITISVYQDGQDSEVLIYKGESAINDWQSLFFLAFDEEMAIMLVVERSIIKDIGPEVQMANSEEYVTAIKRQAYNFAPFIFGDINQLLLLEDLLIAEKDNICLIGEKR